MNHNETLLVNCPNGHQLRAKSRSVGKTLPCPVCKAMVAIGLAKPVSLSETGVMRILGEQIATIASAQPSPPAPAKRDELSDTGVMRILGDFQPAHETFNSLEMPILRNCPVCSVGIPEASSVCKHCLCYVGPSPEYLRQMKQSG